MQDLGSADRREVAREESYHVSAVDSEKHRVAQETLEVIAQFRTTVRARANG